MNSCIIFVNLSQKNILFCKKLKINHKGILYIKCWGFEPRFLPYFYKMSSYCASFDDLHSLIYVLLDLVLMN